MAQIAGGAVLAGSVAAAPLIYDALGTAWLVAIAGSGATLAGVLGVPQVRARFSGLMLSTRRILDRTPVKAEVATLAVGGDVDRNSLQILCRTSSDPGSLEVKIRVRKQLRATASELRAFDAINTRREGSGLFPYYDAVRYLPVTLPSSLSHKRQIRFDVVPIDYSLIALISDSDADEASRKSALSRLLRLPEVDPALRPSWLSGHVGLLGIQLCLVTSDNRLLLRRRGANVLFARGRWDVSVSGFCGAIDRRDNATLDVGLTAEHELVREIGRMRADPRSIRLLGATQNLDTGAFDILMLWQVDATSTDLRRLLSNRSHRMNRVFQTEIRAIERYVWDFNNLIVNMNRDDIAEAWEACEVKPSDFEPQSLTCIELALGLLSGSDFLGTFQR